MTKHPQRQARLSLVKGLAFVFALALVGDGLHAQIKVTHGPLVGAITSATARILVRTEAAAQIHFELDTDKSFSAPLTTPSSTNAAETDFFVVLDVTALSADTKYYYRAVINGSPEDDVRSFRTFPPPGMQADFTFVFGGCQQAADDPNSSIGRVFPLMAKDEPRFFLQLGDWTYPDTTDTPANPRDYFNVDFSRVQASYRSKYDPDFPADELLRVTAIDYIYDDHDYSNNNSDGTFPGRENSVNGYRSMFPHYPLANPANGLWHKFTCANADFFMLDTRTQRDPNMNAFRNEGDKFVFDPAEGHSILQADPTISGELQMDWLIRELQASTADWKFICTSVPFNPAHRALTEFVLFLQGTSLDPLPLFGGISAAAAAFNLADSWNGFPSSVQRLVKAVNEGEIRNVIVLSGDSHTAAIDDGANALFPEVMAGGLDRTNSMLVAGAELLGLQLWNQGGQTLRRNNFNSHYGKVTVFGADSVRFELIDEFGELIASHTVRSGHLASSLALTYATENRDFGTVNLGDTASRSLLLINTAADTIRVESISSLSLRFEVAPQQLVIPPGIRQDVTVTFRPQLSGDVFTTITIESNDPDGPFEIQMQGRGGQPTSVADKFETAPQGFVLNQNYPNPFNVSTRIAYQLPDVSSGSLTIYNLGGQEVRRFGFTNQPAGDHFLAWDDKNRLGGRLASGVYVYRLETVDRLGKRELSQSKKMILLQ